MLHVFVVLSNICSIVIYDTVKHLQEKKESVVILTDRNTIWPFKNMDVEIIDLSEMYKSYRIYKSKSLLHVLKKKIYRFLIRKRINDIVDGRDYYAYLPNMALDYVPAIMFNSKMKGYYIFEEGSLAYRSYESVQTMFAKKNLRSLVKKMLGLSLPSPLKVTPDFLGTIAISKYAFEWSPNKILNSVSFERIQEDVSFKRYEHVVVTSYIDSVEKIQREIQYTWDIVQNNGGGTCGIKFHPHSYFYDMTKIKVLEEWLQQESLDMEVLPPDYIVELAVMTTSCTLYAIGSLSSLLLYSVMYNKPTYYISHEGDALDFLQLSDLIEVRKLYK